MRIRAILNMNFYVHIRIKEKEGLFLNYIKHNYFLGINCIFLFCVAKVDEKAVKLHAIASLKVVIESDSCNGGMKTKYVSNDPDATNGISTISNGKVDKPPRNCSTETTFTTVGSVEDVGSTPEKSVVVKTTNVDMTSPDETSSEDRLDAKSQVK